jgi:hypothetical protein
MKYTWPKPFLRFLIPACALLLSLPTHAMRFSIQSLCEAGNCNTVILAEGQIDDQSVQSLNSLLATHPQTPSTLVLNSAQGDLLAAMRLGQLIRSRGFNTHLRQIRLDTNSTSLNTRTTESKCHTACLLAFLGGVQRTIENNVEVAFNTNTDKGEDLIKSYILSMGANPRLWDLNQKNQSINNVTKIKHTELITLSVDNRVNQKMKPWQFRQTKNGTYLINTNQIFNGSGLATLALSQLKDSWLLIIHIKMIDAKYSFNPQDTQPSVSLLPNGSKKLVVAKPWQRIRDGLQISLRLSSAQLRDWVKNDAMGISIDSQGTNSEKIIIGNQQLQTLLSKTHGF